MKIYITASIIVLFVVIALLVSKALLPLTAPISIQKQPLVQEPEPEQPAFVQEKELRTSTTPSSSSSSKSVPPVGFPLEITATVTHPVSIVGKKGFAPHFISIEKGDSITWHNDDPEQKVVVLTFQQGTERNRFFISSTIPPEEEWSHTFTNEGDYNYWTVGYGIKGKVEVVPCRNRLC